MPSECSRRHAPQSAPEHRLSARTDLETSCGCACGVSCRSRASYSPFPAGSPAGSALLPSDGRGRLDRSSRRARGRTTYLLPREKRRVSLRDGERGSYGLAITEVRLSHVTTAFGTVAGYRLFRPGAGASPAGG